MWISPLSLCDRPERNDWLLKCLGVMLHNFLRRHARQPTICRRGRRAQVVVVQSLRTPVRFKSGQCWSPCHARVARDGPRSVGRSDTVDINQTLPTCQQLSSSPLPPPPKSLVLSLVRPSTKRNGQRTVSDHGDRQFAGFHSLASPSAPRRRKEGSRLGGSMTSFDCR